MQRVLAVMTVALLAASVSLRAADPPKPAADQELQKAKQQAAYEQERLRREFSAFQQSLLTLAQRYEKSSKAEDREKALVLRQAIDLAAKEGIDNQFNKLVATLTASGISLQEINAAIGQNTQLTRTLREMIDLLLTDNQTAKAKEEQRRLQDLLKRLEGVIREQKLERSKTESGRIDGDRLAKGQGKVTDATQKLHKDMGPKDAKGEPKNGKGEPNDGKPKDDKGGPKGDQKDPKDGKPKDGQPKDGKPNDAKPKDGDPKQPKGDPKGDPKDGKPQDGQPKDGDPKDGQPKDGKPKDGKPQQGQPQQGQPQDGDQQPKPKDQQQQQPQDEAMPGRKQVQDAIENQHDAEKNLKKNDNKKASDDQSEAIKKLEDVRKEIERRLKQLREEELERLLANLEARCNRMLALQIEVYEGTKRVHVAVQENPDGKPTRADDQKAGDLSAREGVIVGEANKALQLLEEDGTSVAVPQVLEQCRDDMKAVQARLFKTDVGPFTQQVEEEIIASLKEVVAALKKQQQELKDKKDSPPPPAGQPPPQALINMLAELKMLRSLQVRVNQRTISYGKEHPGEQVDDATVQGDLRKLAERQVKIERATKDIATGKTAGGQP
jgi:hypothetical protein